MNIHQCCILNSNICLVCIKFIFLIVVNMFEQPFVPLLFELLLVSSDGFLFAVVLYLLAAVYLDASPPPPYLGGLSKPFGVGANAATFSFKIFKSEQLIKIWSQIQSSFEQSQNLSKFPHNPVYISAIPQPFMRTDL